MREGQDFKGLLKVWERSGSISSPARECRDLWKLYAAIGGSGAKIRICLPKLLWWLGAETPGEAHVAEKDQTRSHGGSH